MKKIAFLSVYHKEGIDLFAKDLIDQGFEIMSSSGTYNYLKERDIEAVDLATLVGKPILGHRVVTLSREFYAMLLSRIDNKEDIDELRALHLSPISLVYCDMYPLKKEIEKVEKTDIGGPTMLRAAAKGGRIVICDEEDKEKVIKWLKNDMPEAENFKRELAGKVELTVAKYCMDSAGYLSKGKYKGIFGTHESDNCYGENAYQAPSSVYETNKSNFSPDKFKLLTETMLSYNNFCDRDKILQMITHISAGFELNLGKRAPYIAIAVKHGNACGVGLGAKPQDALEKMIEGDVRAIHGGSIFTNFKIDEEESETLLHYSMQPEARRLLDTVTAPDFSNGAVEILARKKGKCRIVVNSNLANIAPDDLDKTERVRFIRDGFLTQPNYTFIPNLKEANVEGDKEILTKENIVADLILAWAIGCTSNSNTITIVRDGKLLGNGVGQQDRVGAAKLAISRADDASESLGLSGKADLAGAVVYSDSFFPFPDGPKALIDRGIKIIFATSGSVNDKEVIEACRKQGATLVMFPDKIARGFAWH
jgi:phosphoribosylaminoimidazolecarboxamide formyltransferase/IMP cyclohydrolase